jgi:phosphoribosyl 1,2-cyclic phosphate phosphodiesterase
MSDASLELLFLGTGTSAGVPMIACNCEVCTSSDPHDKRTRPSAVVSYGDSRILIDTTPELRLQAVANRVDRIDHIVFTHAHADHIMGLDDVRRFNTVKEGPLDVWADADTHKALTRCFEYAFNEPHPEQKRYRPHLVRRYIEGRFTIAGVEWTPVPLLHGGMPVLGFRIGHLAYLTDVNEIPESSFDLLHDLDVLILDALQWKRHGTHFSVDDALAASARIKPRQTLFTHIAHALGHEATNRALPPGVSLSHDGQRVMARL